MPKVSIVIRSKNEIHAVEDTMRMILAQNYKDFEIINVDSGSNDGTFEIIQAYNKKGIIYQIRPEEYIPGKVMNDALKKCRGEIIVFNNSDCIPQNEFWLEKLIKPLTEKGSDDISATFSRQTAGSFTNLLVQMDTEKAFGDGIEHKKWRHFFSMASSAVKREILEKYPFDPKIRYSEDIYWTYKLKKDHDLNVFYVKDSIVEHRHDYNLKQLRKRFLGEGYAEAQIFGYAESKKSIIKDFVLPCMMSFIRDTKYFILRRKIQNIPYSIIYRLVQKWSLLQGNKKYFSDHQDQIKGENT